MMQFELMELARNCPHTYEDIHRAVILAHKAGVVDGKTEMVCDLANRLNIEIKKGDE